MLRTMIPLGCPSPREQFRHCLRTTISGDQIIHFHVKTVLAWHVDLFLQRVHLIGSDSSPSLAVTALTARSTEFRRDGHSHFLFKSPVIQLLMYSLAM